jgi:hypothetical protein
MYCEIRRKVLETWILTFNFALYSFIVINHSAELRELSQQIIKLEVILEISGTDK